MVLVRLACDLDALTTGQNVFIAPDTGNLDSSNISAAIPIASWGNASVDAKPTHGKQRYYHIAAPTTFLTSEVWRGFRMIVGIRH